MPAASARERGARDTILPSVSGSKLAIVLLGACSVLVCACRTRAEEQAKVCERYAQFEGPPVDLAWCDAWLTDWHGSSYARSKRCLSQAKSRLEMRLCEFEDEDAVTAYPFARRECALAATTMEEFEACATAAPIETEKPFEPIGPRAVAVAPATVLGLIHRDTGWHALLLEPSQYSSSEADPSLAFVPVTSEGLDEPVWRLAPEGFERSNQRFLVGGEFFSYVTLDGELRTVRLAAQAQPETTLKFDFKKRRIVAHSMVPGPTGPRGVVVSQALGSRRNGEGSGRGGDDKQAVEIPWLPQYRVEPLGGEPRMLVEYTEDEVSGSNVTFTPSADNYPGAHPAIAWTGPHRDQDGGRPFHVVLFDDDGNETFRTEVAGFQAAWLASTSDGITTVIASPKYAPVRDMTVFRFSVDGELGPRRRLNWPTQHHSIPIACGNRLALVLVGSPSFRHPGPSFADYWDLSGRENLDLPERIWWEKRLTNIDVVAGCQGQQPAVAWIAPRKDTEVSYAVDSDGPFDFVFMTLP
jgi:hypothetical protein